MIQNIFRMQIKMRRNREQCENIKKGGLKFKSINIKIKQILIEYRTSMYNINMIFSSRSASRREISKAEDGSIRLGRK